MVKKEKKYENYLRKWLKNEGELIPIKKQIRFDIKYCDKSCQPDIIACRKKASSIYILEVKDTTGIKGIGQTFGQITATKLAFEKMNPKERDKIYKNLRKKNPRIDNKSRIRFCVAFPKRTKDKSEKIVDKLRSKYFRNIGVCYVTNKDYCEFKPRGKAFKFIKNRLKIIK